MLFYGIYWNMKKTLKDLDNAQVLEYYQKRTKFAKDSDLIEKLLKNKLDLTQ